MGGKYNTQEGKHDDHDRNGQKLGRDSHERGLLEMAQLKLGRTIRYGGKVVVEVALSQISRGQPRQLNRPLTDETPAGERIRA